MLVKARYDESKGDVRYVKSGITLSDYSIFRLPDQEL